MIARRARKLHVIEHRPELFDDTRFIEEMRSNIRDRDYYVIKNLVDATILRRIRAYLTSIGRNSLPSWSPLEEGCPDFHRVQQMNPNSPVQGILHQFMFHPWNQNVFDFFDLFASTYRYRNLISGLESDNFLKYTSSDSYCARLAFQFYPRGGGMMNQHSDPVGEHQLTVPTVQMSKKGVDYEGGGLFLIGEDGEPIQVDDYLDVGDGVFFNSEVAHGVEPIDPGTTPDWLAYEGRWMCLVAVVRAAANRTAPAARQVGG